MTGKCLAFSDRLFITITNLFSVSNCSVRSYSIAVKLKIDQFKNCGRYEIVCDLFIFCSGLTQLERRRVSILDLDISIGNSIY